MECRPEWKTRQWCVGSVASRRSERRPEWKTYPNFLELQSRLESTGNRVVVVRQRFNQATSAYTPDKQGVFRGFGAVTKREQVADKPPAPAPDP